MSITTNQYLAVFTGGKESTVMQAWNALPDAERQKRSTEGMAGWKAWVEKNKDSIITMGGPLGKTKHVSTNGISDISNALCAFAVVQAQSHEAAAKMFESHPHFTIFPGEAVENMPVLPVPESC